MKWLADHHIILANPYMLWLFLLLPLLIWYFYARHKHRSLRLRLSTIQHIRNYPVSWKVRWRAILPVLQLIAFSALVLALSRPQKTDTRQQIDSEGIDIVLSMDISGSMLAEDFKPNRIEAAKNTAIRFIQGRPSDRIGLVVFAGESFTQCPITIDHHVLVEQIAQIKSGMLEDGTAIGMGLGTAVDRLRNARGESRVVILMTDGVNNVGKIDPQTALEIAKAYKVRVYTIGIGTRGEAMYPMPTSMGVQKRMMPVQIDEALLKTIAEQTGGRYFRATDNQSLKAIYKDIDEMEKTKVEISAYKQYAELFFPFAFVALGALLLAGVLRYTLFKSIT